MSASARQKIAAAQRARWAKVKRGEESGLKEKLVYTYRLSLIHRS